MARLALEAFVMRPQDLDGDGAAEARVRGFVDVPHSACAQPAENFIWAEAGSRHGGHKL